jgi:hypothetical protein
MNSFCAVSCAVLCRNGPDLDQPYGISWALVIPTRSFCVVAVWCHNGADYDHTEGFDGPWYYYI